MTICLTGISRKTLFHPSSHNTLLPLVFSGVRIYLSLVFCVVISDHFLSFCSLSIVLSILLRFWLPLWYHHTFSSWIYAWNYYLNAVRVIYIKRRTFTYSVIFREMIKHGHKISLIPSSLCPMSSENTNTNRKNTWI